MLRCYQPRKNRESVFPNGKIMKAATKTGSPEFDDPKPAPFGSEYRSQLLQRNNPMRDTLQLQIGTFGGSVVEKQHRAFAADKELFERQDLTAIAQRALGEKPHF